MRVRATKAFSLGGGVDLQAGDVIDQPDDNQTQERIRRGKFEVVPDDTPLLTQPAYRKGGTVYVTRRVPPKL